MVKKKRQTLVKVIKDRNLWRTINAHDLTGHITCKKKTREDYFSCRLNLDCHLLSQCFGEFFTCRHNVWLPGCGLRFRDIKIEQLQKLKYLGNSLTDDGKYDTEIRKRFGKANDIFQKLSIRLGVFCPLGLHRSPIIFVLSSFIIQVFIGL